MMHFANGDKLNGYSHAIDDSDLGIYETLITRLGYK